VVTIESPFPEYAIPRVWVWLEEFRHRVLDDSAPRSLDEFVSVWKAEPKETWAVYRDGEIGGLVEFRPLSKVAGEARCFFKRTFWTQSTTETALRKVYAEIFSRGYLKICNTVFRDNHPLISLLRSIGATREGVLERHTLRQGKPADLVLLATFKEKF